jgi:hypothetical protein
MDKGGQFYIVAALIVILIISGLVSLSVFAIVRTRPAAIFDISNNLEYEGPQILDYGVYTQNDIQLLLTNFTDGNFAPYYFHKTREADILFLYGNKTDLYEVTYNVTNTGDITVIVGPGQLRWPQLDSVALREQIIVNPGDSTVNVTLLNQDFSFTLQDNEMFYFVMIQEQGDEVYVQTNE